MVHVDALLEEEPKEPFVVLLGIVDLEIADALAGEGVKKTVVAAWGRDIGADDALGDEMVHDGNRGVHEE